MKKLGLLYLLVSCLVAIGYAQVDTGNPSFEPTHRVNAFETINLTNLNILLEFPLRSKDGPVPSHFMSAQNAQLFLTGVSPNIHYGSSLTQPILAIGYFNGNTIWAVNNTSTCPNQTSTTIEVLIGIQDGTGTVHTFAGGPFFRDTQFCIDNYNIDAFTNDGSGMEFVLPPSTFTPTVYDRDGVSAGDGLHVTDPHGNTLSIVAPAKWTDSLTSTAVLDFSGDTPPNGTFTYTDAGGTTRTITETFAGQTFKGDYFTCSGYTAVASTVNPVTNVAYPDGSSIGLTWETGGPSGDLTGRLGTLTVPTGAQYVHNYNGGTNNQGVWCGTNGAGFGAATMLISDGVGTWTFARNSAGTQTTVTKPDGSNVVYNFYSASRPALVSKVVHDTNGTTVLDTMTYCYDSTISSCNPSTPATSPTWIRIYHTVPGVANNAEVDTKYDSFGNIVETDEFDFGPTLVRKTFITYGSWNGSSCTALSHIVSKPCQVYVQDSGGTQVSLTTFNYDATGDLLTKKNYSDATHFLTTTSTYNSNGTMATHTTTDGVQTTFAYNGTGGCNSLLPTSMTNSIGTMSYTWDCNGTVVDTTTDFNSFTTTLTYNDPDYRITNIHDNSGRADTVYSYPSATRFVRDMTFNGGNSIDDTTVTVTAQGRVSSVQHRQSPTSSNYDTVSQTYDTTGHLASKSQACAATVGNTCATQAVTYAYDGADRFTTKTVKTSTNGVLSYTYPNGDIQISLTPAPTGENAKTVLIEPDALGRVLRSCVVTALAGSGSCGARTTGSGYLTKNTLDALSRPTQISRNAQTGGTPVNTSYVYDQLSRITSQTIPESGTSTFVFDAATSTCTTAWGSPPAYIVNPGDLAQSTDAANNVTCYSYQYPNNTGPYLSQAGRLSVVLPTSGPNLALTPQIQLGYDRSTFGSTNNVGRLSSMENGFPPPAVNLNSIYYYSYTPYGKLLWEDETTPHLAGGLGSYRAIASYYDNGAPASLSGVPGVSNYTFGLDGEGRLYSATSNSTSIVSSVSYNNVSNPLTITYGNGDTDAYTYDANTQNMTQYQFKLNGVTDTGVLTWNPNSTLQKLAITDNIAGSGDTQTCTTGHDDLTRITTWNCGAFWTENYAYTHDYAGNVTKSGSLSFAPGYTAATNRMLAPWTYDANGNMLHDGTLGINFTWSATGGMATEGSNALGFDAYNRMVQKKVGSVYTDFLYSPLGKLGSVNWNNGTPQAVSVKIPLPGGGSITYDNAGNQQLNHVDFQGSTRLVTNRAARTFVSAFCYGPMGEIYCGTPASAQYEGSFEDTVSGLTDFNATRYSGTQGRSISPTGGSNGYVKTNSPF